MAYTKIPLRLDRSLDNNAAKLLEGARIVIKTTFTTSKYLVVGQVSKGRLDVDAPLASILEPHLSELKTVYISCIRKEVLLIVPWEVITQVLEAKANPPNNGKDQQTDYWKKEQLARVQCGAEFDRMTFLGLSESVPN